MKKIILLLAFLPLLTSAQCLYIQQSDTITLTDTQVIGIGEDSSGLVVNLGFVDGDYLLFLTSTEPLPTTCIDYHDFIMVLFEGGEIATLPNLSGLQCRPNPAYMCHITPELLPKFRKIPIRSIRLIHLYGGINFQVLKPDFYTEGFKCLPRK